MSVRSYEFRKFAFNAETYGAHIFEIGFAECREAPHRGPGGNIELKFSMKSNVLSRNYSSSKTMACTGWFGYHWASKRVVKKAASFHQRPNSAMPLSIYFPLSSPRSRE